MSMMMRKYKLDMTLMSDDSIDVFLNMNDVLLMKRIERLYVSAG